MPAITLFAGRSESLLHGKCSDEHQPDSEIAGGLGWLNALFWLRNAGW